MACEKYEEDDNISFRKTRDRLCDKPWNLTEYMVDNVNRANDLHNDSLPNGLIVNWSLGDAVIEFKEPSRDLGLRNTSLVTVTLRTMYNEYGDDYFTKITTTSWDLDKKKENITFEEESWGSTNDFGLNLMLNNCMGPWRIKRLTKKELILYLTGWDGHSYQLKLNH